MHTNAQSLGECWRTLRQTSPLIHNITNYVAMDASANVLLAAGAAPAMIHAQEEAADFAGIASALVLNIGTLSGPWVTAMEAAAERAHSLSKPVVLDPVGAGATPYRTGVARQLLQHASVVRGNASEIMALETDEAQTRGVDSTDSVEAAMSSARRQAAAHGATVVVTGPSDYITDGARALVVRGGDAMLTRVTAMGCALSSLIAAGLVAAADPLTGAATACLAYAIASERAAKNSQGPGTFRAAFLDALHALKADTIEALAVEYVSDAA